MDSAKKICRGQTVAKRGQNNTVLLLERIYAVVVVP
jgi:hypothetical protein